MKLEKKIERLEILIKQLEQDDIDLDTSVQTYKRALTLAKDVMTSLNQTQASLTLVQEESGLLATQDVSFDDSQDD